MKKLISWMSVAAVLTGLLLLDGPAWSQTKPKAPAADAKPHKVGLIDMAHVFKEYKKFESLREELKIEISGSEQQAKAMAEKIKQLQAELKEIKEGRDGYDEKEKELAKASATFETFRRSTQRDILKKESEIYHQVYMEVSDAVKKYSKYYGYTLVLRFNREDLNPEDPQGLIQGMNRQVVFHQPEDDMTDSVLSHLNEKYGDKAPKREAAAGAAKSKN